MIVTLPTEKLRGITLSFSAAGRILGVDRSTVRRMCRRGILDRPDVAESGVDLVSVLERLAIHKEEAVGNARI